jgi:hypothetical protein
MIDAQTFSSRRFHDDGLSDQRMGIEEALCKELAKARKIRSPFGEYLQKPAASYLFVRKFEPACPNRPSFGSRSSGQSAVADTPVYAIRPIPIAEYI